MYTPNIHGVPELMLETFVRRTKARNFVNGHGVGNP